MRPNLYRGRHPINADAFGPVEFSEVFRTADDMREKYLDRKIRPLLKYFLLRDGEPLSFQLIMSPSTRTAISFQTSIRVMGGIYDWKPDIMSSLSKGESAKSMATILGYFECCDCIIVRYDEDDYAAQKMADAIEDRGLSPIVIDAGSGTRSHVTQMFLDMYTYYRWRPKEFYTGDITYAFIGDLSHSRTIHSDLKGLENFGGTVYLVGPEAENVPSEYLPSSENTRLRIYKVTDPLAIADKVDAWYFTRSQDNLRKKKKTTGDRKSSAFSEAYWATKKLRDAMKKDAIVLHPLPHGPEFEEDIDLIDHRFQHFPQALNGIFVRMALLKMLFAPHVDIKQIASEYGKVEMSGYFHSIPVNTKNIIGLCCTENCLCVELRGNGWEGKLQSKQEKLKVKAENPIIPWTFCNHTHCQQVSVK
ncbi:MAG: Aspartate carbamoyltransferase [Parcubacteria group bacterium GW2011_GWA2_45_30]|nr:MAG: Aspartate carbamoyltransferase [Parcubacteria group bacterium GW2011_GWA2_45_30]